MRSLVLSIFLYVCESWTLTAELEKRTPGFKIRPGPEVIYFFFMLTSSEHEIFPAHKC